MKKIIGLFTLTCGLMFIGCADKAATTEVNVEPEKTIIIEKTETVKAEKEPEDNSTTIVLDKNGVKVEAKKIDVNIKTEK